MSAKHVEASCTQAVLQQLRNTDMRVPPALSVLQLHAAYSGNVTMQGYLLKHRPVTQLMGLFAQEWEMRCACTARQGGAGAGSS